MAKTIEKDSGHGVAHGEIGRRPAGHPVLLQYVLAREGNQGPVLFRLPLGFDEEALVVFDLLKKSGLGDSSAERIKSVAIELLEKLKAYKLRIDHWQDKEATRDDVRTAILDFLWDEESGLPVDHYDNCEVEERAEEIFRHVYRVYPTIPSPYYSTT